MSNHATEARYGLALSGGGFRASIYHLGVIRFLREAGLLRRVGYISSVSGGSVIGAHLALNWDRYLGTDQEFDDAAGELVQFMRLDVRNRIVRRFPLAAMVNQVRRLTRFGAARGLTRAGLLEGHYERFLFGETPLFQLPDSPRLFMLATDLSEGSLSAFCKDGLLLQRRSRTGKPLSVESITMGLGTVPMAVAASSAFPGFFPPLELNGRDVGASDGEFARHAFTDGGIFDNLGLRFFRYLRETVEEPISHIFVSDAGATFRVRSGGRAGGLLRTAMRSSDILLDRVNQLELESFSDTPGAVFLPITRQVSSAEDRHALHPEIQWQAALIRTDLDRFSELEISALAQHGYCVARQETQSIGLVTSEECLDRPPWHPFHDQRGHSPASTERLRQPSETLACARRLQRSASRRTLSTLFDWTDWPSYVWAAVLLLVVSFFPYLWLKTHRTAVRQSYAIAAVSQTSPVYRDLLHILDAGAADPIPEMPFQPAVEIKPLDFSGYEVVTDDRIYDLRGWSEASETASRPTMHARFRFRRTPEAADQPILRIHLPSRTPSMKAEYSPKLLGPEHVMQQLGTDDYLFETRLDFSRIPIGADTDVIVRQELPTNMAEQSDDYGAFRFTIAAETSIARIWALLPDDRMHTQFQLSRFPLDNPHATELVEATSTVSLPIGAIANFELVNPEDGYRYECRWKWVDEE